MFFSVLCCILIPIFLLYVISYILPDSFGDNNDTLQYLQTTLSKLKLKRDNDSIPVISVKQFKDRVKDNERLSVCFGYVLDIDSFIDSHPGGTFLDLFVGRDMTPWMLITHAKSNSALKYLSSRVIGYLPLENKDEISSYSPDDFNLSLLPDIDAKYVKMFFEFNERRLFATPNAWTFRDFIEVYIPLLVGFAFIIFDIEYCFWLGIALMGLSGARQGIFYHDIMHRSVFACALKARNIVKYTSLLIWGFDFNSVGDVHDIHHGFVNIIGLDTAIDMPLLPVDPIHKETKKASIPTFIREYLFGANTFFYGFLAWMILPYYTLVPFFSPYYYSTTKDTFFSPKVITTIRIMLSIIFWDYQKYLVIAALLGFFYFAFVGSLNHFHKEMITKDQFFNSSSSDSKIDTFVALQSQTVQNTDHGDIVDALLGHFTLHIEHHLFPLMPRRNLPRISNDVMELLKQSDKNLVYSTCSQSEAVLQFNKTLRSPFQKQKQY